MNFSIRLMVGSVTKHGSPVANLPGKLQGLGEYLADRFGGFSQYQVTGGYKHADGRTVLETTTVFEILGDAATYDAVRDEVAGIVAAEFEQESVLVSKVSSEYAFVG
jgi:hypothetical protein